MSVTVQNIVDDAIREIGAAGGDTVSMTTAEKANNLRMINGHLDSLYAQKVLYPRTTEDTKTLTANTESYTIGSGGDIDTVRPIKVVEAFIRDSDNNDFPLDIIEEDEYRAIRTKKISTGRPYKLFYNPLVTLGKIFVYYIPDDSYTLYLYSLKPFTQFAAITDAVTLSPAEQEFFTLSYAIRVAGSYNRTVKPSTLEMYNMAKATLEEANRRLPALLCVDLPGSYKNISNNILTGDL